MKESCCGWFCSQSHQSTMRGKHEGSDWNHSTQNREREQRTFFCIHFSGHGQCIFEADHELTRGETLQSRKITSFVSCYYFFCGTFFRPACIVHIVHFTSLLRHILVRRCWILTRSHRLGGVILWKRQFMRQRSNFVFQDQRVSSSLAVGPDLSFHASLKYRQNLIENLSLFSRYSWVLLFECRPAVDGWIWAVYWESHGLGGSMFGCKRTPDTYSTVLGYGRRCSHFAKRRWWSLCSSVDAISEKIAQDYGSTEPSKWIGKDSWLFCWCRRFLTHGTSSNFDQTHCGERRR